MATEVVMPQMGESIAEGTITRWLVKVGEKVERDQPLFEISTDKVDAEIPSPAAGVLLEIRNQEGETVPVNQVVAMIGEAKHFRSGREFAACLGLVPRQSGTGGRVKLLGISKRGDVYLRTLLIHGARAVLNRRREPEPWLQKLLARRPPNVVAVALANKMARRIWALLAHGRTYEPGYVSTRPVRGQPVPQGH